MAITRAQQVRQMLEEGGVTKKIKGQEHMLAYITPGEAKTLESLGGQKTMTPEGIPAYPPPGKGASTGKGGSGGGTGKDQTSGGGNGGGGGGNDYDDARMRAATNITAMQEAFGTKDNISEKQQKARDRIAAQRAGFKETLKQQRGGGFNPFEFTPLGIVKKIATSISNSPFAKKKNLMQRQNYLDYLSRTNPKAFQKLAANLVDQNLATADMTEDDDSITSPSQRFGASDFSSKSLNLDKELAGSPDVKDAFGEGYQEYLDRFDPKDGPGDRGGGSFTDPCKGPNPPAYCFIGTNAPATEEEGFDFARLLAEGGMPMDAPYVGGGLIDAAGRQQYFLGRLVKSAKKAVKGVTRSLKKIAKSPIGRAAIIGGLGYLGATKLGGLSGIKGSLFGQAGSRVGEAFIPYKEGLLTKLGLTKGGGSLMPTLLGGSVLGIGALSLFNQPEEEDEDIYRGPDIDFAKIINDPYAFTLPRQMAEGGRIGYSDGTIEGGAMMSKEEMKKLAKSPLYKGFKKMYGIDPSMAKENNAYDEKFSQFEELFKKGFQEGGDVEPVAKKTMPLLDMDGKEMDLRAEGGFVPIGRMEKADDVPARLSKNEFVFTADAVRNAGEGDVDKGAEVMYNMMKNLESGGDVSEESQGLSGAREMFQTSKRLEEVL